MPLKDQDRLSESLTYILSFKSKCDIARKGEKKKTGGREPEAMGILQMHNWLQALQNSDSDFKKGM